MKNTYTLSHDKLFHDINYGDHEGMIDRHIEIPANSYSSVVEWEDTLWSMTMHTNVSSLNDCRIGRPE